MDGDIFIYVRCKDRKDLKVRASIFETVLDLKLKIEVETNFNSDQQKVVFKGKILENSFTLGYYGITNDSIIFLVLTPMKNPTMSNPRTLIQRIKTLLAELKTATHLKRTKILAEIKEILEKPTLIAFLSFSKDAADIAKEASEEIKTFSAETETEKSQLLAQQTDIALNQIEGSSDGLRTLQHFYEEELEENESEYAIYADDGEEEDFEYLSIPFNQPSFPTIIPDKPSKIPKQPLPTLSQPISMLNAIPFSYNQQPLTTRYDLYNDDFWSEKDMKKYMKQKYSQQIAILKYLGFEDEQNIIKALGETNGNVQLAYQILQNQVVFSH